MEEYKPETIEEFLSHVKKWKDDRNKNLVEDFEYKSMLDNNVIAAMMKGCLQDIGILLKYVGYLGIKIKELEKNEPIEKKRVENPQAPGTTSETQEVPPQQSELRVPHQA